MAYSPQKLSTLRNAQSLARLLDASITVPGTRFKIGLDPVIGLVPGIGDFVGVLLSISILLSAARLGVTRKTLLRMAANVAVEGVIGTVPLVGDLFDAGWRANVRNVALMEAHLADPERSARASGRWLFAVAAGLAFILLGIVGLAAWLLLALFRFFTVS